MTAGIADFNFINGLSLSTKPFLDSYCE